MSRRLPLISSKLRGAIAAAICAGGGVICAAEEPPKILDGIQHEVAAVFEKCRSAVVKIEAVDAHGRLSGTGFFIDPIGTLYTSFTVGGESRQIIVNFAGKRFEATRLISDVRSGIAILKIEAETPFLTFAKSADSGVGSPVIAIGYPMDLPLTPAFGTVGGFDLKYLGRFFATTHIRANIAVQRGEGGAPLLTPRGEVVGILISRLDSGSASFALPIEAAEKVRKDFVRFHAVRPGWIGVHVKSADTPVAGSTAEIEELIEDAPGKKADLRAGDVILEVGARKITSPEDVLAASFFISAEDELPLRIVRAGEELTVRVEPVDPPNATTPRLPTLGSAAGLNIGR